MTKMAPIQPTEWTPRAIESLCDLLGTTRPEQAAAIGIPLRTLENWLGGRNQPGRLAQAVLADLWVKHTSIEAK